MSAASMQKVMRAACNRREPLADALRILAVDAVEQAQSGHPGAPMGMAEMALALWDRHLVHNPANPRWWNRDRFVLSNGHASMLLYALLHLTGYALSIQDLRQFRQRGSRTPGHPEVGHTPGVETTTGPLGQGLANAVGMALAEQRLRDEFNRDNFPVIDHRTWVFAGDGCLMEGISHEAIALAGAWRLNRLTVLYDDNGISIDGPVAPWFIDDTGARFRASGWQVIGPIDGHDVEAVDHALSLARASTDAPTLVICRTNIGHGSPGRAGTARAHGEPLGQLEVAATRAALGWSSAPFEIPAALAARWDARERGARAEARWRRTWDDYRAEFPLEAGELERRMLGVLPADFASTRARAYTHALQVNRPLATRKASQDVLAEIAPALPELLGGSADLTGSNLTDWPGAGAFRPGTPGGRYIHYGVREFGMAAIMNGIALHGGYIPYGGTFLTFSDYSRNAIRMAALMKQRVVHVFTHDSIGLGEDGPTHQPIEHAASLRLIPGLDVWRPADAVETALAWSSALERADGPSALLLTRQALAHVTRSDSQLAAIRRGGYVVSDRPGARVFILATGSELAIALDAQRMLDDAGLPVRVVSMPSTDVFDRQHPAWRDAVLPPDMRGIAIEAGATRLWAAYGCVDALGIDCYGESAPGPELMRDHGLTAESLLARVRVLEQAARAAPGDPQ